MNSAENESAAFFQRFQRCRKNLSCRRKDNGGVEFLGRFVKRSSSPYRAQFQRQFLMTRVARRCKHLHAPVPRYLNRNVRRRSESIKAQPPACFDAREPQRPEADDSRAKQRRGLLIGKAFRNRINKIFGGDNKFRVAAIHAIAREQRSVAKIFRPGPAVFACSVRSMQPGNANAGADPKAPRVLPLPLDNAHNLVAGNHR